MASLQGFASNRLLAKNSILNLLGMVLPLIVGIISIPFAVKGLGKEGFGVLAIAWVVLGYFGLFDFGLSRATTKFVSEMLGKGDVTSIPSIVWTAVLVSFFLGIIGALILFAVTTLLVENLLKIPIALISDARTTFYILASSIPIVLCSTSFKGILEAAQRFDLVNYITIPASMMSFILPGISYPFNLNLSTVVFLIVLSRLVAGLAYFYFCIREFPGIKSKPAISGKNLKMMLYYGGWISVTNVISPLLVYMDRFFIGTYISMTSVAFYTAPYEVVTRLRIFPSAIATTLFPEFSALAIHADSGRLEMLFARALKYVLISVGMFVVVLFFMAPMLLQEWLGVEFAKSSLGVFRILTVGVLINSLAIIPFNLLQGVGRPDITAKFHLLEFPLYLFLLWLLIRNFGINGAALAWTLRVSLDASLLFLVAIRSYPLIIRKIKIGNIGRTLLLILLSFCSILLLDNILSNTVYKVFFAGLSLFIFFILAWHFILDNSERQMIKRF